MLTYKQECANYSLFECRNVKKQGLGLARRALMQRLALKRAIELVGAFPNVGQFAIYSDCLQGLKFAVASYK